MIPPDFVKANHCELWSFVERRESELAFPTESIAWTTKTLQ